MNEFVECEVVRVRIEPHPDADSLEVAYIEGQEYTFIVGKGQFQTGDEAVYLPEDSILPDDLLEQTGLTGRLRGSKKNRVRASVMRGVASHGLLIPNVYGAELGADIGEQLGVTKYYPPMPMEQQGVLQTGPTISYKIQNWHQFPDAFTKDHHVVITEKIHGTWCCLGYSINKTEDGSFFGPVVTSKGHSQNKKCYVVDDSSNPYLNAWRKYEQQVYRLVDLYQDSVYVLGEVYGRGIQSWQYSTHEPQFAVFDIFVGDPTAPLVSGKRGRYLDVREMWGACSEVGLDYVPLSYSGGYSEEEVRQAAQRKSHLYNGDREGVVIRPLNYEEYTLPHGGRLLLKYVSEKYIEKDDDKNG